MRPGAPARELEGLRPGSRSLLPDITVATFFVTGEDPLLARQSPVIDDDVPVIPDCPRAIPDDVRDIRDTPAVFKDDVQVVAR